MCIGGDRSVIAHPVSSGSVCCDFRVEQSDDRKVKTGQVCIGSARDECTVFSNEIRFDLREERERVKKRTGNKTTVSAS